MSDVNIFVNTEQKQEEHARQEVIEEARAGVEAIAAHERRHVKWVEGEDNVADPERQLGQAMTATELERRLKKLNPDLRFEYVTSPDGQVNRSKKRLITTLNGTPYLVCIYEAPVMPEFSIRGTREQEIRAPVWHLDRKDVDYKLDGKDVIIERNPGLQTVAVPWEEKTRGWRTVLTMCLIYGLLTEAQVEKEFGAANSPGWAKHVKGQKNDWPW